MNLIVGHVVSHDIATLSCGSVFKLIEPEYNA